MSSKQRQQEYSGEESIFSPLLVPILPWKDSQILSHAFNETVYANSSFATAIRLITELGVPPQRGAIGVPYPLNRETPPLSAQHSREILTKPGIRAAWRAVVLARNALEDQTRFAEALTKLRQCQCFGVEIRVTPPCMSPALLSLASLINQSGMHSMLSLTPKSWHCENQEIIDSFDAVALPVTPHCITSTRSMHNLRVHEVVAQIIDAKTKKKTNLEAALKDLVLLRNELEPNTVLSVGIAKDFTTQSLQSNPETKIGISGNNRLFPAKEKIWEALALFKAFHFGKESVATAFAANQISRAAHLASLPLCKLPDERA